MGELWPGAVLDVGGRRLHVRRAAPASDAAEPAVLVHGLGGSATNWTDLMTALRDRLDAWAPDIPGFGWSDAPRDRDYSPGAHARAVADLIETVGGPVHLVGNSLGGAIAMRVAAQRPELVSTLTLISPALPAYRIRRTNAHLPLAAVPLLGEWLLRRAAKLPVERRVRASFRTMYADPAAVPPERLSEAIEELNRRGELAHADEALLRSLRAQLVDYATFGSGYPWRFAAQISRPTLIVQGARDSIVGVRTARRAARTIPGARLVVLEDSGHVPQMEHPAEVARLMREHLDGSRPAQH